MSRIGKKPVELPKGVKASLSGRLIKVEGPKGTLTYEHRPEVSVTIDEGARSVSCAISERDHDDRVIRAYWGLTRALIQNMVRGVSAGYERKMEIVGVGWSAQVTGKDLKMQLGYADPVIVPIPPGLSVSAEKQAITITGADKQLVGSFAAVLRTKRPPEPYNGKGVKYTDEVIRRKEGKRVGS